jgi:hypothetical protein
VVEGRFERGKSGGLTLWWDGSDKSGTEGYTVTR